MKHCKTKSACEKSFDNLINKKCSWSYKALHEKGNESVSSSPPDFSSVTTLIPSRKKPQKASNSISTDMNGITKESDIHIPGNTNGTDMDTDGKIPSSAESIFDNLILENKLSSTEKTSKNCKLIKSKTQKRRNLRPSKPINYAIDISNESSSDEEMVLQTRIFNATTSVDNKNYDSDHNYAGSEAVLNKTPTNTSNQVCESKDSSDDSKELCEGMEASENFESGSIDMPTKDNNCKGNMYSNSIKKNVCNDTIQSTDKNKTNQDNTRNSKLQNGNISERESVNSTEAHKMSKTKKTEGKEEISRIDSSQSKRKLGSPKSNNSGKEIKNYELTADNLNLQSTEQNMENDGYHSDSNQSFYQTSFPNLSNSDQEFGEDVANISDFSDESEQNEITTPLYARKGEHWNSELEENEKEPRDFYSNDNNQNEKATKSKKPNEDPQNTEMSSSLSEYVSPSYKTSNHESLYTKNNVSDMCKDTKNTDIQNEIKEICYNVCSEVQSIGDKTEMSGSLSEDDDMVFDFLNGSFDMEKYKLKVCDENSPRKEQKSLVRESTQIRNKKPESSRMVKGKQPTSSKSETLKEKTLQLKNEPNTKATLKKYQTTEKQSMLNAKKQTGKTNQTSEHITLQNDLVKANKIANGMHTRASTTNNGKEITTSETNHKGQPLKQKQPRKKNLTLEVSKHKNSKEIDDFFLHNSDEYKRPSFDNSFNEFRRENIQLGKSLKLQKAEFTDKTKAQNNYISNIKSSGIQNREENVRYGKNNKETLKFDCSINASKSYKNNGNKEICILSSENDTDNAENEIKLQVTQPRTKKNPHTWEDLETLLLTNDSSNKISSTSSISNLSEENFQTLEGAEILRNNTQLDKDEMPFKKALYKTNNLDGTKTTPARYSFNRLQPKKLTFSEEKPAKEKTISTLAVKSSPNMSIIERTIAKMNNCTSLCSKPRSEVPQLDKVESLDESYNDKSPILTEYSYAIQEFKSTRYYTTDNGISTTKETRFTSQREEKGAVHKKKSRFPMQNYEHCVQDKSVSAVTNSKEMLPISDLVSPKTFSTRLNTISPAYRTNKRTTTVSRKQKILLTPEMKIASNSLTLKSNTNIVTREENVKIDLKSKNLKKKNLLDESDSFVTETEDESSSEKSIGFNFGGEIDEKKNYNLRKRKCHKVNEDTVNNFQENTKKQKRESNGPDQQLYNSKDGSNLKTTKMLLLNEDSIESEYQKSFESNVKQRKSVPNIKSNDHFLLKDANSETEERIYTKEFLNKSGNFSEFKQNDFSPKKKNICREKTPYKSSIANRAFSVEKNLNKKNKNSIIPKGMITTSYKITSNISNTEKNIASKLVEETKISSLKPLQDTTLQALMSSKEQKKEKYDKYQRYLKELSQHEDSFLAKGNSQNSILGNSKSKNGRILKQELSNPKCKEKVKSMAETSDDDVFSISSFDADSEKDEVHQTQGTGCLIDLFNE